MERRFRESKLAVPFAVIAAALGMTACGAESDLPEEGKFTSRGYEQQVDSKVYRVECNGGELVKKLDRSVDNDPFSFSYPGHPACEDSQLTKEDANLFSLDPFVNEYTFKTTEPNQSPSK